MKKILRIDMGKYSVSYEDVPDNYANIGGRLLTSTIIMDEVPFDCEPLQSKNKLIIAPGIFAGTYAPSSGRLSVGGKSPLTGGIKESNSGGVFAKKLALLEYKCIIVENKPEKEEWYILKIDNHGASLLPANNILGLDNYEACKILQKKFGNNVGILITGEAGEKKFPIATCAVTDRDGFPARHAARGGMGAVMGSKCLKAVIVDDEGAPEIDYKDKQEFRKTCKSWAQNLVEEKSSLTNYGTAVLVNAMSEVGCLATKNFSQGTFEGSENLSGETLAELQKERNGVSSHSCMPGCVIRCSNVYNDINENFLTASLEFETIVLLGSNLGIDNLDLIANIDRFCDGLGIDTMDFGDAIAVAMEGGYLSFGDENAVLKLLEEVKNNTIFGRTLVQGVKTTGQVLGVDRIPHVKGQGISAYDPRALKGTGVTYATSPMGADHTAGNCLPNRKGFSKQGNRNLDPHDSEGKVKLSKEMQIMSAMCDTLGLCVFVGTNFTTAKIASKLLTALYGKKFTVEDTLNLGRKTILKEIRFNEKAGINNFENRLPDFFRKESLPPTNLVWDIDKEDLRNIFIELKIK